MQRITPASAFAALIGVVALIFLGYQDQDAQADRYASLLTAVNAAYDDIDDLRSVPVQEQIIELPEDGSAWYTSLVSPAGSALQDPAARRLEAMLASNPRLRSLLAQTHVNRYHPGQQMYEAKYRKGWGVPSSEAAFILSMPDGKVVYKVSGQNIPADADTMANQIAAAIADCCPRPKPKPTPDEVPQPDLTPAIPDTVPDPGPTNEQSLATILVLMGIGGIAGAGLAWRKEQGL